MRGLLYEHCVRYLGQTVLLPPLAKNKPSRFDGRGSWLPRASIAGTSGYTTPDTASGRRGMRSARGGRAAIGTGGFGGVRVGAPRNFRGTRAVRPGDRAFVSTSPRGRGRSGGGVWGVRASFPPRVACGRVR